MRLLTRPEKVGYRQLRQELVDLCGGDCCAALILDLLEFWTGAALEKDQDAWQPGGRDRISQWICSSYSPRAVADRLDKLVEIGFLATRDPEGVAVERQYLLLFDVINEHLTKSAGRQFCRRLDGNSADGSTAILPTYKEREGLREEKREENSPTPLPASHPVQESHEHTSTTEIATGDDPGQNGEQASSYLQQPGLTPVGDRHLAPPSDHLSRLQADFDRKNAKRERGKAPYRPKMERKWPAMQRSVPRATVTPPNAMVKPVDPFEAVLREAAKFAGCDVSGNGVPDWMLATLGAYSLTDPKGFMNRARDMFGQAKEQGLRFAAALNAIYLAEKARPGKTKRELAAAAESERIVDVLMRGGY